MRMFDQILGDPVVRHMMTMIRDCSAWSLIMYRETCAEGDTGRERTRRTAVAPRDTTRNISPTSLPHSLIHGTNRGVGRVSCLKG